MIVAFWIVFRQLKFHVPLLKDELFAYNKILFWRKYWQSGESWGALSGTSHSTHASRGSLPTLPTSALLPKSTING